MYSNSSILKRLLIIRHNFRRDSAMYAYILDILITHSIVRKIFEEDGIYTTYCDLVEIGPFSIMEFNNFNRRKKILCIISTTKLPLTGGLTSQHGKTSLEFLEQGQNYECI
jgi:hypothetical protein